MNNVKHQIQDANRIEERMEKYLKEKQLIYEKMEAELVHLRKELDAKFIQTRYENSSKILDEIITTRRDPSKKNGISYSQEENQVGPKYYAVALLSTFKEEEEEKTRNAHNSRIPLPSIMKELKETPKKVSQNRYPYIFLGYYFACSNFGHKVVSCRAYEKKRLKGKNYNFKNNQTISQVKSRNYNSFTPLQERDLELFNFHNYGHKEIKCRLMEILERVKDIKEQNKIWK